jgi:L-lactate dehydrogenase
MDFLADESRANRPVDADRPVRLPGDQAARSISAAQTDGVAYDAATWSALERCAAPLGVAMPPALA